MNGVNRARPVSLFLPMLQPLARSGHTVAMGDSFTHGSPPLSSGLSAGLFQMPFSDQVRLAAVSSASCGAVVLSLNWQWLFVTATKTAGEKKPSGKAGS
jgi:hypothetical protein